MTTEAPWTIHDNYDQRRQVGYINIVGPNGEAVCTLFPTAGKGGVGYKEARANAELICRVKGFDQAIEESLASGIADQPPYEFLDKLRLQIRGTPHD